jgi:hypothetical protein
MLSQTTRSNSIGILSRLVMRTQQQILECINFLQNEIDLLSAYLPETYQLLMKEMDHQQRDLMTLKIQSFYDSQSYEP